MDVHKVPLELKCQMALYLRKYTENGNLIVTVLSPHINFECQLIHIFVHSAPTVFTATALDLEQLVTFWVGWAILPEHLYVEVTDSVKMSTAFTCSENIKLSSHYTNFMDFEADLKAAVSTTESGCGLV